MKKYNVTVNGNLYQVEVEEVGGISVAAPAPVAAAAPATAPAPVATPAPTAAPAPVASGSQGSVSVKAPMQGTILKVNVSVGDTVKKGDVLCVLEAMKMENEIKSAQDGVVASVAVRAGESVETDALLVSLN